MINITELKNNSHFVPRFTELEQLDYIPGIWINGKSYWLQDSTEKVIYDEAVMLNVKQEQIHSKIRLFNHFISNHSDEQKELKVLGMHHYSNLSKEQFTFIAPAENVIYHLNNSQIFLVNGQYGTAGIKDYTIQPFWNVFTDEMWSNQEKGILKFQPLAKGHCASVLTFDITLNPHETVKLSTWNIKGKTKRELLTLNKALLKNRLAFQ
ncbi:MAG: hypothetical protein Q8934_11490 [Bacillota bacterium]|nr:hypothetical protein [Bacillota bacterium]